MLTFSLRGPLAANTLWTLAGQAARIAASGVAFLFVARKLGPEEMGAFIAVSSLAWVLAPFSGLGFGMLLIQRVSRDPREFRSAFGEALASTALSGGALVVAALIVSRLVIPESVPPQLFVMVGLVELIAVRLIDVCSQSFQAHSRMRDAAAVLTLLSAARLGAAGVLILGLADPTASDWAALQLAGCLGAAVAAYAWTVRRLGAPVRPRRSAAKSTPAGLQFSLGLAAQSIYNDIDKAMLARMVSLPAAGVYGTTYKLVEISFAPVRSLLLASSATLFAAGAAGPPGAVTVIRRLVPYAAAYSALAAAGLFVLAPMATSLLGAEYAEATDVLRGLALLPLIRVTHSFAADALGASGRQGVRSAIQVAVALLNVILNLVLLPTLGIHGAVVTSLLCELLLGGAMITALRRAVRQHRDRYRGSPTPALSRVLSSSSRDGEEIR